MTHFQQLLRSNRESNSLERMASIPLQYFILPQHVTQQYSSSEIARRIPAGLFGWIMALVPCVEEAVALSELVRHIQQPFIAMAAASRHLASLKILQTETALLRVVKMHSVIVGVESAVYLLGLSFSLLLNTRASVTDKP